MNLRKQLFAAFLSVAVIPLIVVVFYMFATNLMLAFDLHEQNLLDSTEIQADLVEENINRLMVRTGQFASSQAVRNACREGTSQEVETAQELTNDILNFTDETLDNVAIFALLDQDGELLYSSGSNNDTNVVKESLSRLEKVESQNVLEIPFAGQSDNLIIYTPVQDSGETVGSFLTVCRTDFLLKIISSHRQIESSNALIYCRDHHEVVVSKQDISGTLPELDKGMERENQGSLISKLDNRQTLVYYRNISKTPWVLVSTTSIGQIFSQVWSYGLISIAALLVVLLVTVFLSSRQSRRMLRPLDQLLGAVEKFFLAGAAKFPETDIDPKSEIGYLAEKFSGLSDEIALAQGRLRESNYLYAALLRATYEFRIVIDLRSNTVECSSSALKERIKGSPGQNASDQVLTILTEENYKTGKEADLHRIVYGMLTEPIEAEAYFRLEEHGAKYWYRVVAVPIMQGDGSACRVVLHFADIDEQKREELRLIQSSRTDPLCGLLNKTAFPLYCHMSKDGSTDAMFFIDLDKFKMVNDTLGHTAGDEVLVSTAHAICAQFRDSDVVGRFGGDEFVVFAPGISMEAAEQKARQLLQAISFHLNTHQGAVITVTASVGVCMAMPPITLEQAIKSADEAMYQAKEKGRAQFCLIMPKNKK